MKTIWDYPVSYGYGNVPGYTGFHTGEDRGNITAFGLPVTVNGVTIGTVGFTGRVEPKNKNGTHTHIGRWVGGKHTNPNGGGQTLPDARVIAIDTYGATDSGKYVRVRSQGVDWVYCHLDSVTVEPGQELKGEDVRAATKQEVIDMIGLMWGMNYTNSNPQDIDNHVNNWAGKPFDQAYYATYLDGRTLEHAKSLNVNKDNIVKTWKAPGLTNDPPASYVSAWDGKRWKPYIEDLIKQPEWINAKGGADAYKEVGTIDGQKIYKKG